MKEGEKNMDMKKITVVTVCYNAGDLMEATVRSVLGQTYPCLEYIIIDGGSTDGTPDIIRKYSDRISYWVSEPDKGIYDAMNKGIKAATGDYILFMNAGDAFASADVVEKIAPALDGSTVVSGKWHRCYRSGEMKTSSPKATEVMRREMPICHQATFVRADYHKANLFDTSFRFSADYDFFYRAWRRHEAFRYVDTVVADFREEEGASAENITASVMEREKAWKGEGKQPLRRLDLRCQVLRIKLVKILKKAIQK